MTTQQVKNRQRIEKRICSRAIRDAIKAGYTVSVDNGEEVVIAESTNYRKILAEMFSVDEESLFLYRDGKYIGQIMLVYGNDGHDVIADYSTSLEEVLAGANELADKLAR